MLGSIVAAAAAHGDRPAFVAAGDAWALSYRRLHLESDRVAAGLARSGIGPGSVVALALPSTIDYAVAYVAASKVGAITAGVNPRLAPTEQQAIIERTEPDLVITTEDALPTAGDARQVVVIEPATGPGRLFPRFGTAAEAPTTLAPDPARVAAIVFTSGTTGTPKGALFTDHQLSAIARADIGVALDEPGPVPVGAPGGAMIASTQFAHIGFMTKLPWYLYMGTTTFLLDRWRAADVLALVARERITTLGAVAPQIALMLRCPEMDELDLSCVERIVAGAGPSSPTLVAEAKSRFGAEYSIRYSSTESGGVGLGTAFDADDDEALSSVGRPRGDVEVQIWSDDLEPIANGEIGELVLRSSSMMTGYWRAPDETAATLVRGWLRTGDLARLDDRGLVRLAGRRSDMFIRGGYNVYPLQVEALLAAHPGVAEIAVVPRPDPVMGETGVAVVVPRDPSAPPTVADLRSFGERDLASYKLPEAVRIVRDLPRTAMGKIDRRRLGADLAASEPDVE